MTLPVAAVAAYLTGTGWHATDESWHGARVWARNDVRVLLPVRDDLGDNPARVRDLLRSVAATERRTPDAVARDVGRPDVDAVVYRLASRSTVLALPAAVQTVQGLRDLIRVAARTALEGPHLSFPPRSASAGELALVGRSRLALADDETAPCTVLVPIAERDGLAGRDVVAQLHDAAVAAREVIGTAERPDAQAFVDAVTAGVSKQFCASAAALAGPERSDPFVLDFRWGHGSPAGLPSRAVAFPPGAGRMLQAASRALARLSVSGPATAIGRVDGMHDEVGSTDRWRVKVRGDVRRDSGRPTRGVVWARVADQHSYDVAVEAYRSARRLRVAGELTSRDGRVELAIPAEGIETLDEPEDDRAR